MECRSATSVALVALVVSLCTLVLLFRAARAHARPPSSASPTVVVPQEVPLVPHFTCVPPYTQVGMLEGAKEPIPLYGRPTRRGGERWNYYAMTTTSAPHMLPVSVGGRECARLLGCAELSDGDAADVRGYGAARAALYTRDPFC